MKKREVQYKVENGHIVMWDGIRGYTPIARVINDQHCRIIVRTLEFAEDCEECIDEGAMIKEFRECFSRFTRDIMLDKKGRKDDQ